MSSNRPEFQILQIRCGWFWWIYNGSNCRNFWSAARSWMSGEPMNYVRGYSVSAVVNDTIYVIGGVKDGRNIVDAVSNMSTSLFCIDKFIRFIKELILLSGIWQVERFKEGQGWEEETGGCTIRKRCFHSGIALSPWFCLIYVLFDINPWSIEEANTLVYMKKKNHSTLME